MISSQLEENAMLDDVSKLARSRISLAEHQPCCSGQPELSLFTNPAGRPSLSSLAEEASSLSR